MSFNLKKSQVNAPQEVSNILDNEIDNADAITETYENPQDPSRVEDIDTEASPMSPEMEALADKAADNKAFNLIQNMLSESLSHQNRP